MTDPSRPPTIADIAAARTRIAGHAVRTPLLAAPWLSEQLGATILVKPECLQRTGSFKFRGAYNAVAALAPELRARGIVAVSSGNHAQGVAEAARLFGIAATIVMPDDAPALKIERTERSGARVVTYDRVTGDRDTLAAKLVEETGGSFIHPFNDPHVIAGQGTVGLEIAEDLAALGLEPNLVLVPVSGGGLLAGVALALADRFPAVDILAAEPEGFDDYGRSLAAGTPQRNARQSGSIADALMSPTPGAIGFVMNLGRVAGGVAASDEEALAAIGHAFDEMRLVAEPGGAMALAAVLSGRVSVAGRTVVIVVSGGNVSDAVLAEGVRAYRAASS